MPSLREYTIIVGDDDSETREGIDITLQSLAIEGYNITDGVGWSRRWGAEFTWRIAIWAHGPAHILAVAERLRIACNQDTVAVITPKGRVKLVTRAT